MRHPRRLKTHFFDFLYEGVKVFASCFKTVVNQPANMLPELRWIELFLWGRLFPFLLWLLWFAIAPTFSTLIGHVAFVSALNAESVRLASFDFFVWDSLGKRLRSLWFNSVNFCWFAVISRQVSLFLLYSQFKRGSVMPSVDSSCKQLSGPFEH